MSASLSSRPPPAPRVRAPVRTVSCDAHGRLAWLGHVECDACGAAYKRQPASCRGYSVDPKTRMARRCASTVFRAECAKCYVSETKSEAETSFEERGELGSPGLAD
jgi:hypothetical protein